MFRDTCSKSFFEGKIKHETYLLLFHIRLLHNLPKMSQKNTVLKKFVPGLFSEKFLHHSLQCTNTYDHLSCYDELSERN